MKIIFADTGYWIAVLNPKDDLHLPARAVSKKLGPCRIVTSEMVLVELLGSFSKYGAKMRKAAVDTVLKLKKNPNIEVVPQASMLFQRACDLYSQRLDKEWSATDCAGFIIMEEKAVTEALATDHHFEQAGFVKLLSINPTAEP